MSKTQKETRKTILVIDADDVYQIIHEELDLCADRHAVFRAIQRLTTRSYYATPLYPTNEAEGGIKP